MSIGEIHEYIAQCYDCLYYSISRGFCDIKKEHRKAWQKTCKQFKDWNDMSEQSEQCCGGCSNFLYEDTVGHGICAHFKKETFCDMGTTCEHYTEEPRPHCSQCKNWNMGFDNSCAVRIAKYDDYSNQPANQTACEDYEPDEVSHG